MVTFTLKLGISILNGGNILVQQVHFNLHAEFGSLTAPAHHLLCFYLHAENAGLPEGKKRCWLFQKFVWTDDVLQVI